MPSIQEQLDAFGDTITELAYVLKAIEELSVEKGAMTRAEIQVKIIELSAKGWSPTPGENHNDRIQA